MTVSCIVTFENASGDHYTREGFGGSEYEAVTDAYVAACRHFETPEIAVVCVSTPESILRDLRAHPRVLAGVDE